MRRYAVGIFAIREIKNPCPTVEGMGRMFALSINADTFPKRIANDTFFGAGKSVETGHYTANAQ